MWPHAFQFHLTDACRCVCQQHRERECRLCPSLAFLTMSCHLFRSFTLACWPCLRSQALEYVLRQIEDALQISTWPKVSCDYESELDKNLCDVQLHILAMVHTMYLCISDVVFNWVFFLANSSLPTNCPTLWYFHYYISCILPFWEVLLFELKYAEIKYMWQHV